jgi:2-(1,2-epoxy-1,2-dihydrophenyl)acetyl-CoA isomerase
MALSFLGDVLPAKEAERMGMIYKCVPDAELMKETMIIAEQLAKGPTIAFVETRKLFDSAWTKTLPQQLEDEKRVQSELADMPDFTIGVKRFQRKSKEEFTGSRKARL